MSRILLVHDRSRWVHSLTYLGLKTKEETTRHVSFETLGPLSSITEKPRVLTSRNHRKRRRKWSTESVAKDWKQYDIKSIFYFEKCR